MEANPRRHTLLRAKTIATGLCLAAMLGAAAYAVETVQSNWRTLGDPPPSLNVDFVKGEPISLEDGLGNNVFVVEFWATWCGPCKYTIPHLTELQRKYGERGLVIIGISDEGEETVRPYLEKMDDEMDYRVALDRVETTTRRYFGGFGRETTIPTAFVIDGNGRVAWIGQPGNPFMETIIGELLTDLPMIRSEREAEKSKSGGDGE